MKKGDLVYLIKDYDQPMDGLLTSGDYELLSDEPTNGDDGYRHIIYDWVVGPTFVPASLLITIEEKKKRERNNKLKELGI